MMAGFVVWTSSQEEANWMCFAKAIRQQTNGTSSVPGDPGQSENTVTTDLKSSVLASLAPINHLLPAPRPPPPVPVKFC